MLVEQAKVAFPILVLILAVVVYGRKPFNAKNPHRFMGGNLRGLTLQGKSVSCYDCDNVDNVENLENCPKKMAKRGSVCYTELKIVKGKATLRLGTKKARFCSKAPGDQAVWESMLEEVDPNQNSTACRSCCNTDDCNDGPCPSPPSSRIITGLTDSVTLACEDHPLCSVLNTGDDQLNCSSSITQEYCKKACDRCLTLGEQLSNQPLQASLPSQALITSPPNVQREGNVCAKLLESFTCQTNFVSTKCPLTCLNAPKLTGIESNTSDTATLEPTTTKPTTLDPTTPKPTTSELNTYEATSQENKADEPITPARIETNSATPALNKTKLTRIEPSTLEPRTTRPTTLEPTTPKPTTSEPNSSEATSQENKSDGITTTARIATNPATSEHSNTKLIGTESSTPEPMTNRPNTLEPTTPTTQTHEECVNVMKLFSCEASWVADSCPDFCP